MADSPAKINTNDTATPINNLFEICLDILTLRFVTFVSIFSAFTFPTGLWITKNSCRWQIQVAGKAEQINKGAAGNEPR